MIGRLVNFDCCHDLCAIIVMVVSLMVCVVNVVFDNRDCCDVDGVRCRCCVR